jgi:hypothetical protein
MAYIPVIDNARLAADAVTSDKILDDEITNADIDAAAGILFSKLEATPWYSGNDGAGSGLDADLLDGSEGSFYLDRANHTGTQLHTTISDFDAGVQTNTLDSMATPVGDVAMGSFKITGLADGVAASDAINLGQLTAVTEGLSYKEPADVATTGNITLSGEQTIDGVLTSASRVLVKDQSTGADNGIYLSGAGAWVREADADSGDELDDGATIWVKAGTANGDKRFTQTAAVPTVGGAAQTWVVTGQQIGSTVVSDNTDVDTTGAVDGSLFRYEASASEWQSTTASNMLLTDDGQLQLPATNFQNSGIVLGGDTNLYREAANQLRTDDQLNFGNTGLELSQTSVNFSANGKLQINSQSNDAQIAVEIGSALSAFENFRITALGGMSWGDGSVGTHDVNLYRSGADTLATDDSLTVGVDLSVDGVTTTDGRRLAVQVVAASAGTESLTEADDDVVIVTNTGASAHTIELPATPTAGQRYRIKDGGGGAATNNITVSTAGAETIDGAATFAIDEDYMAVDMISDGANYFVL